MWRWVIGIALSLLGIGGSAYGYDQHRKRHRERADYRPELKRLEERLREVESRCGRQSTQFCAIAAELERLQRRAA